MKTSLRKLATDTLKGLVGLIGTIVVTALITGQPLAGLVKLKGLYQIFIQSSVPAWAFAVILMLALFGAYYAFTHRPKRKGKIVFIQDAHNNGWSKQNEAEMNLRLGGSFAYTGAGYVHILKLFLKGTKPLNDLLLTLEVDGGGHMIQVKDIHLSDTSYRMFADLRLTPVIGTPGKPLRATLIVHDKFAKDFEVGTFDFPYIGPDPARR